MVTFPNSHLALVYGASTALFVAAAFYMLVFAVSYQLISPNKSSKNLQQIISVFVLAGLAYFFFGVFNTYALKLHFPQIREVLPAAFFWFAKFSAPISLMCFTLMFTRSSPVISLDAYTFWKHQKKYYNLLYILDVLWIVLLFFMHDPQKIVAISLLLFVPHCFAGVIFSFKGLSNVPLSKLYGLLFLMVATAMFSLSFFVGYVGLEKLPAPVMMSIHLFLGITVLMLSFVAARFNQEEFRRFVDMSKVNMEDFFANMYYALKNNEFYLVYQPKLDLQTNSLIGIEALIRWQHPKKGLVMPNDFIPAAEETEIIDNVCQWTIKAAIQDAKRLWQAGKELPISINFSVKNLHTEMVYFLHNQLKEASLPVSAIMIEITESLFLYESEEQTKALGIISQLGIKLALDDYGAGFSSLSHLDQLGIDEIKIDKSFIINLEKSAKNLIIVSSTVQMGQALGISVVAEGIEDDGIQQQLAEMGCEKGQGFGIAKPMPFDDLLDWLPKGSQPSL